MSKALYIVRISIALIVFIFSVLFLLGIFYPIPFFHTQLVPLIQNNITNPLSTVSILLAILTVITVLFGRIFCSVLCPLGTFQEIITLITNRDGEKRNKSIIKYFIMVLTFGTLFGGTVLIIKYLDPYTIFSSALTLSIVGIITLVLIGILAIFKNRFFCSDICPCGTLAGLIAKFSLFKIYIDKDECFSCGSCERACPTDSIDSCEQEIDNETCVKCLKCMSACPKGGVKFGIQKKK